MSKEVLVRVENVSKKFCRDLKTSLWYGVKDLTGELLGGRQGQSELRPKEFWAVKDVSFELRRGECLGLIGRNGAGKSTLLKMLNGLIKPDTGRITMDGRVGALIELGSGFNPILTGRENIYNNGSVLGISKKEIDKVIDEIIAFSEIEKFIDSPVAYYSSGMKVRLGFSVAVHMKPDVLILDEVLAVGDSGFKIKSFNKINEMMKNAAVIFVSHSMPNVAIISNKILLMEYGQMEFHGEDVSTGIDKYFDHFGGNDPKVEFDEFAQVEEVTVASSEKYLNLEGMPAVDYQDDLKVGIRVKVDPSIDWFHVKVQLTDKDLKIVGIYDSFQFQEPIQNDKEIHDLLAVIPNCIFINGEYSVTIFIQQRDMILKKWNLLGLYRYWTKFRVKASDALGYVPAVVYLPGRIEFSKELADGKSEIKKESNS
ncbi:MAG: lipopolysaccharide transport system ATP-binding protein [Cryomorphaceae bacterium]|jgi:lipopolysaccharide transport system ATP-binding protein